MATIQIMHFDMTSWGIFATTTPGIPNCSCTTIAATVNYAINVSDNCLIPIQNQAIILTKPLMTYC